MKILDAKYEILTDIDSDKIIMNLGTYAGVCYKGQNSNPSLENAKRVISNCIKDGHESVIEHEKLTVKFFVDRGITHELVRHRLASFTQESTRYCNYSNDKFGNDVTFIDIHDIVTDCASYDTETAISILNEWYNACKDSEKHYLKMLELGSSPQIARSVLNNSTAATIIVTANLREWRTILKLRTAQNAHPQMLEVMHPLLKELKSKLPIIFDDIS